MTQLAILLDEVQLEIKSNPNFNISSRDLIIKNLNRSQKKLLRDFGYQVPQTRAVFTTTITSGTKEIALPDDFVISYNPSYLTIGGVKLQPAEETEMLDTKIFNSYTDPRFDIVYDGGYKIILQDNSNLSGDVVFYYHKSLPDISESQEFLLDNDFDELIVYHTVYLTLRRLRGEESRASDYYNEYLDLLNGVRYKTKKIVHSPNNLELY